MKCIPLVVATVVLACSAAWAGQKENDLLASIRRGDEARVARLLQRGANPNAQNKYGTSALMLAVQYDARKTIDLLLRKGASIHLRDKSGYSVLGYDYALTHTPKLIARGARITPSDSGMVNDALDGVIFQADFTDSEVKAQILLCVRAGLNLNHRGDDEFKYNPLHTAASSRPTVIRLLLDSGADPNLPTKDGITPIMLLLSWMARDTEGPQIESAANLLLDRGAKVNVREYGGKTPLMNALRLNRPRLIQRLLQAGAHINAKDFDGITALMHCAREGRATSAKQLLKAGADFKLRDKQGSNALDMAITGDDYMPSVLIFGQISPDQQKALEKHMEVELKRIQQGRALIERMLWERGAQPAKPFRPELFH